MFNLVVEENFLEEDVNNWLENSNDLKKIRKEGTKRPR